MTVEVYSKPACPQCNATHKALDKLKLAHPDLDVVHVDLTLDPAAAAMVKELGYSSAPVVIAGADHWSGFRPDRIAKLAA